MAVQEHIFRYHAKHNDVELILPYHRLIVNDPLDERGKLDMLVWNIFKQKRAECISMLEQYANACQLVLLQEAQTTPELINYARAHHLVADQVPAFTFNEAFAGVMTLSNTYPMQAWPFKEREPLIRLPKSALITLYPLTNGSNLLVANIHAVNFSFGIKVYQQQMRILLEQIYHHQGPVIMAGDFNTWSRQRLSLLYQLIRTIKLKPVNFTTDMRKTFRGHPLDFVFYRNLQLEQAKIIDTLASDHNPLRITFNLY